MSMYSAPSVDVERARVVWNEYCQQHDVTMLKGKTAGIEPVSGRVWLGESGIEVHDKAVADGIDAPLYCIRVGYDYYVRKGVRR